MAMFRWTESEYLSFIPDVEKMPPERFKLVFRFLRTQKRLEELEDAFDRIETAHKKLEIEWAEVYDKFRHLHFRVSKRVKLLEESRADGEESGGDGAGPQEEANVGVSLTARQIEANERILARRRKMTQ